MYSNLMNELKRKNITQNAVACMLDCTERTLTNKLNGTSSFTINEAFAIHRNLLPEFKMDYLFATENDRTA